MLLLGTLEKHPLSPPGITPFCGEHILWRTTKQRFAIFSGLVVVWFCFEWFHVVVLLLLILVMFFLFLPVFIVCGYLFVFLYISV